MFRLQRRKFLPGSVQELEVDVEEIEEKGDDQFEISDGRSVKEVYDALLTNHLQPVMSDYIYV